MPSQRHEDSSFKHIASWVSCFWDVPLKVWALTFLTHQDRFCDYLFPAALSACGNESAARYVRGSTRQFFCEPSVRSLDSALQIAFAHFGTLVKKQFLSQTFLHHRDLHKTIQSHTVWLVLAFQPRSPSKVCSGTMASLS